VQTVIATGGRAAELALRCTYAGFPAERIEVEPDFERALDRSLKLTEPHDSLVLLPTYTAMLALRRILATRGHVAHYWERAA